MIFKKTFANGTKILYQSFDWREVSSLKNNKTLNKSSIRLIDMKNN